MSCRGLFIMRRYSSPNLPHLPRTQSDRLAPRLRNTYTISLLYFSTSAKQHRACYFGLHCDHLSFGYARSRNLPQRKCNFPTSKFFFAHPNDTINLFFNQLGSDAIFLFCVNILGLYFRFVNEVVIRRTFLDRRACVESTLKLNYEKEQEVGFFPG